MRLACLILVVFWFAGGGARAASPMVEAYKAYLEALDHGDIITADRKGEKAWQEAEKVKNKNYSAILAYNLAELRVRYLPRKDAITPAKRALELTKNNPDAALALQNAQVLSALANFIDKPNNPNRTTQRRTSGRVPDFKREANNPNRKALKWALKSFENSGLEMSYPIFRAHFEMMKEASSRQAWRTVLAESKAAEKAYKALEMDEASTLASVKLFAVSASLIQSQFENIEGAQKDVQEIFDILGPQHYDRPNALIMNARAWMSAMLSMKNSSSYEYVVRGDSVSVDKNTDKVLDIRLPETVGRPQTCQPVQWIKHDTPKYPQKLVNKGYVGAAFVQYSLGEDGVPTNVKVSAEVPVTMFGPYAADKVRSWRAKPMPGVPAACREFLQTEFRFQIQ